MKKNRTKGITLIALVITIIILLILAGITIATLTGSGLFEKATQAAEETKYANAEEKVKLAVMASYDESGNLNDDSLKENLNNIDGIYQKVTDVTYDLTVVVDGYEFLISEYGQVTAVGKSDVLLDNTEDTDIGKEAELKDGWATETVRYIKTSDGTETTEVEKVATVYAISVGNGETVPVPYGFYYVGGNLETGVIISDNEADKYDGITDKTTWEYTTSLVGNQFIWIPCEEDDYVKTNWGSSYQNANWDTTTGAAELTQIQKYGGFYVGRYEAGLASSISELTSATASGTTTTEYNTVAIPQSKAGQIPWILISWTNSKLSAESMYNNNYVSSGLITGTQWDVMLNNFVTQGILTKSDLTSSSLWGNYRNTSITYTGRLSKGYYSSSVWYLPVFGDFTSGTTGTYNSDNTYGDLLTTGASEITQAYHIFDVAGNIREWTEEVSFYGGNSATQYRVGRGGNSAHIGSNAVYGAACSRTCENNISIANIFVGFRVVLYIK